MRRQIIYVAYKIVTKLFWFPTEDPTCNITINFQIHSAVLPLRMTPKTTQLLFQQNALTLLEAQDITICTFCLCIPSPYMFQPTWAIFRGRNASA
jgi:hypothetical protein